MAELQIQPHKIRSPIQLLAVWFTTLVIADSAFLTAAATITAPPWISPMLAVASVLFVPIFLIAAIVMQTRFRAHLQEDSYFSDWQKRQEEQLRQLREQQERQASNVLDLGLALISPTGVDREQQERQTSNIHDFDFILERLAEQQKRLDFILKSIVTKFEIEKLKGLAGSSPFFAKYHPELFNELKRLDAIGFIQPTTYDGLNAIRERFGDEKEQFDLKEYIALTEMGRECVKSYYGSL